MHPDLSSSPQSSHHVYMLAIMKQWNETSDLPTDNTVKFLMLILFKTALDTVFFHACSCKWYSSFLNVCSLSIVVVDWMIALFMAIAWFLGPERFFLSPCFILASASTTFGALPLPMMFLGTMDYCLDDTSLGRHRPLCKLVRNVASMLLMWTYVGFSSFTSVDPKLMEMDFLAGERLLVCKVQMSLTIAQFLLVLFSVVLFPMVVFCPRVCQWMKEAGRLSAERANPNEERSDLFHSILYTETKGCEKAHLDKEKNPRPPLWFSCVLAFAVCWMPYITVSVACLLFGLGIPAYIAVNLMWVQCVNSVLSGVMFWMKSQTLGPYSNLPENMCSWQVYWYLSKGMQSEPFPVSVFIPSKEEEASVFIPSKEEEASMFIPSKEKDAKCLFV